MNRKTQKRKSGKKDIRALVSCKTVANHVFFTVADLNYYVFLEKLPQ